MPSLSVIIPTHRRAEILANCLEYLGHQTIADELDVIVISDGPDEATAALFGQKGKTFRIPANLKVRLIEIPKSHQGTARNAGVQQALAPHCLFINDDIYLFPDACERHLNAHRELEKKSLDSEQAILGYTTWDPTLNITPVMHWLEDSGWQFGYTTLARFVHEYLPARTQHLFTYSSHISVPTTMARAYPFLTDVSLYGWEDIEWGMRLRDAGIRIYYEPEARAWHHHLLGMAESLSRMETLGVAAVEMRKRVPEFDRVPTGSKLMMYRLAALLPTMAGRHRRAFLRGIREGTN